MSDDLTPLLRGSYTLLLSPLREADNERHLSSLHQFTLLYSLSDESDLLLSALLTNGRGLAASGSASLRVRPYSQQPDPALAPLFLNGATNLTAHKYPYNLQV